MKKSLTTIALVGLSCLCFALWHSGNKNSIAYSQAMSVIGKQKDAMVVNKEIMSSILEENEELKEESKNFKKVENVTKIVTRTIVDTVHVTHSNIIDVGDDGSFTGNVEIDSTFYSLSCTFTEKDFTLNRLEVPNKMSIIVGDKKIKGWIGITKGKEYSISVNNSNPYVSNISIETYKIVEEKKWWETRGFAVGVGLIGGILIAK